MDAGRGGGKFQIHCPFLPRVLELMLSWWASTLGHSFQKPSRATGLEGLHSSSRDLELFPLKNLPSHSRVWKDYPFWH